MSAPPTAAVLAVLARWLVSQRWFPAKDQAHGLQPVAAIPLTTPRPDAWPVIHLLRLGPDGALLQVPVTAYAQDASGPDDTATGGPGAGGLVAGGPGAIGTVTDDRGRRWWLRDGCHDEVFLQAWTDAATRADDREVEVAGARVATGEQSNTSVLLPATSPGRTSAILKVFRVVTAGANPDVEVPLALARAGWAGVPAPLGWLTGRWPEPAETTSQAQSTSQTVEGHLGVLSELITDAQDGFELACAMAGRGQDFTDLGYELGVRTAEMHAALRTAFPAAAGNETGDPDEAVRVLVARLRGRAEVAVSGAESLAGRAGAIRAVLTAARDLADQHPEVAARVQRVHGDYHLGQVLRSAGRGWLVLDFEGEPMAPAHERTRPDLALRDVAGMLRSFDYAAAVGGATDPDWVTRARAALLEGYAASAPPVGLDTPAGAQLLRALELDKALYEVLYEQRSRPDWVHIPLAGVQRLLSR